jgi:hypothetical protein
LCAALILCLTAAEGDASFDVRILLATAGLGGIVVVGRHIVARDLARTRWEYRVDTALWGPEDANGKRDTGRGLVAIVGRIEGDLGEMTKQAKRAASAAEFAAAAITTHQQGPKGD